MKHNNHTSSGNPAGLPFEDTKGQRVWASSLRVGRNQDCHGVTCAEIQEKGRQRQSSLLVMLILVRQILISIKVPGGGLQVITLLWNFSQRQVAGGFRKPFCCHPSSSTGLTMALQNSYVAMIFKTEQAFHQGVKGKASEA